MKHPAAIFLLFPLLTCSAQMTQLKVKIDFTGTPALALKLIDAQFASLGYRFETENLSVHSPQNHIEGTAVGTKPLNAAVLVENLKESGIEVEKAGNTEGGLYLSLVTEKGIWNVQQLGSDEGAELQRSNGAQWFRVEPAQVIRVESPYGSQWYPELAVLDQSMNVLYSYRSDKPKESYEFELPEGAYYLKVSNVNGMKVLREGMWIESATPGR